jgi:acyl-coenzyme A thioesterase PaaI-like protein
LRLSFRVRDDDTVYAEFQGGPDLQGYDGILHGGVIASLLDAAMTHCLFHHGIQAVTGDLHVRFIAPVPCRRRLEVRASVLSPVPPLYRLRAELVCEQRLMAWAEAKFMQRRSPAVPVGEPVRTGR